MAEYTKNDVCSFGSDAGVINAIGKVCYFGGTIEEVVENANTNEFVFILKEVTDSTLTPFVTESGYSYSFMIVKKENSLPKYIPFPSKERFMVACDKHVNHHHYRYFGKRVGTEVNYLNNDIWLRNKEDGTLRQVIAIGTWGVNVGGLDYNIDWDSLFKVYEFLDGSPCGIVYE